MNRERRESINKLTKLYILKNLDILNLSIDIEEFYRLIKLPNL